MVFCSNCGEKLNDGAKFCHACGASTSGIPTQQKREQEYAGKIIKCPNCGEVLDSFVTVCPACGYELRGSSASSSVREFAMKLDNAATDAKKVSIIRNYPVPNTKEDIFEFMILASTNIIGEQQKKVFDA